MTSDTHSDLNYSLHYARWHSADVSYFKRWHQGAMRNWSRVVGRDKSARILDIGCGTGLSVFSLRETGYTNVIGIDTDPEQLAIAHSHGLPCQQVTPSPDDAFYGEHRGEFDIILMYDLLEHIAKAQQVPFLRSVRRCLAERGRLILRVPNALGPAAMFQRYVDHTHHCSFTIESLDYVLRNAGFRPAEIMPCSELRLASAWRNPWHLFRLGLVLTTRAIWRAAYVGELGRPALALPMTRDLLARTTPAA
jgi:2-polyprenyl-3-methyl-5-hydroxy-6-metoxy-1,4-benzoquinol methylase